MGDDVPKLLLRRRSMQFVLRLPRLSSVLACSNVWHLRHDLYPFRSDSRRVSITHFCRSNTLIPIFRLLATFLPHVYYRKSYVPGVILAVLSVWPRSLWSLIFVLSVADLFQLRHSRLHHSIRDNWQGLRAELSVLPKVPSFSSQHLPDEQSLRHRRQPHHQPHSSPCQSGPFQKVSLYPPQETAWTTNTFPCLSASTLVWFVNSFLPDPFRATFSMYSYPKTALSKRP